MKAPVFRKYVYIEQADEEVPGSKNAYCVIGALAKAAGVDDLALVDFGSKGITEYDLANLRQIIEQRFGLTTRQMDDLQDLNDSAKWCELAEKLGSRLLEAVSPFACGEQECP